MWFKQEVKDFGSPSIADVLAFPKVEEQKSFHKLGVTVGTLHNYQTDKKKLENQVVVPLSEPAQMENKFIQKNNAVICLDRTFAAMYEQHALTFPSMLFHHFTMPEDGEGRWFIPSKDSSRLLRPLQWRMLDDLLQQNCASLEDITFAADFVDAVDLAWFNSEYPNPKQRPARGILQAKELLMESAVALVTDGRVGTLKSFRLKAAEKLAAQRGWLIQKQLEKPDG